MQTPFKHKQIELDDSCYGLPLLKLFPLTTQRSIQRTIDCFYLTNSCFKITRAEKIELIEKIKRRIKETGIVVSMTLDNGLQHYLPKESFKIIDKDHYKVSTDIAASFRNDADIDSEYELNQMAVKIMKTISDTHVSFDELVDLGRLLHYKYTKITNDINHVKSIIDDDSLLYDALLEDMLNYCVDLRYNNIYKTDLVGLNLTGNMAIIYDNIITVFAALLHYYNCTEYVKVRIEICMRILQETYKLRNVNHSVESSNIVNGEAFVNNISLILEYLPAKNLVNTMEYLDSKKKEKEDEIYIITARDTLVYKTDSRFEYFGTVLAQNEDYSDKISEYIYNAQDFLESSDLDSILEKHNLTLDLDKVAKLVATRYYGPKSDCTQLYFFTKDRTKIYAVKEPKDGKFILNILASKNDGGGLYSLNVDHTDLHSIKIINIHRIIVESKIDYEAMTEGLDIEEDGSIKISFRKKRSYMDEYAKNHKLFKEAIKKHDMEEVKLLLALTFVIIDEIEFSLHSKKKPKNEEELEKARMFLMNDFKTYMKVVVANEPSFNFTKYYTECDEVKDTYKITTKNIVGLKKLFMSILA